MKFTSESFTKTILFLFPLLVQTWAKVDVFDDPNDVLLDEQNLRTKEIDHRSENIREHIHAKDTHT